MSHPIQSYSDLDVRSRAALATIVAGRLCDLIALSGSGSDVAEEAVILMERWVSGKEVAAEELSKILHDGHERGVALCAERAVDQTIEDVWNSMISALAYVAYQAYSQEGRDVSSELSEVSEATLDHMFDAWRKTACFDETLWDRAVEILSRRRSEDEPIDVDAILVEIEVRKQA